MNITAKTTVVEELPPEPPKKNGIPKKELLELLLDPPLTVELPEPLSLVVLLEPSDDEKDPDLKSLLPDFELEELPDLKLLLLLLLLEDPLDLNPDDDVLACTITLLALLLSNNVSESVPKLDKLNTKASINVIRIFLPAFLILFTPFK
ncbi:hypothetical protein CLVI_17910 [Clostridium vincentii]|uniref:Uncharacterized protein n=1 Tax=Clostridium vincentii TaxID=52704 RepID=A0A2T0BEX3_9CLOT|nr:hypothetical protein CLVI_17910 [Clostridium vincentii]